MRYFAILVALAVAASGTHFSSAAFISASRNAGNGISSRADWTPPAASASVIAKTADGTPGYIRQGGTYYVYANVTDSGNPASGTTSVTANVAALTTGQTAVALEAGSYTANGSTYNYRSASLTALTALTEGPYGYTHALADAAGNNATQPGFNVTVDNTAPTASDVQTTNTTGGTPGKPEAGDHLLLTFSEPIEPNSILASWTGTASNVVVRITDGGLIGNDVLSIRNATNAAQLPLGSIELGRGDYVLATRDFGATGTASVMAHNTSAITIKLGTASGTTTTATTSGSLSWTPSTTATDRAGNPAAGTSRTETGTADTDF